MARFEATTQYRGYKLRLDVSETNVDTENNRSKVYWELYIVNGNARFNGSFTYSASINGTSVVNYSGNVNTTDVDFNQPHKLASGTTDWIGHNSDGSKIVYCSASCSGTVGGYGPGDGSCGGNFALTTTKRTASITTFNGNNIDENFVVGYTKYVDDWKYYLRISIQNGVQVQRTEYNTSGVTFRLSEQAKNIIYNAVGNNDTVNLSAVVETYNGGTKVGESSAKTNTCTINRNMWINVNGAWKRGIPYVNVNGTWKMGVPYININGEWKKAI